MPSSTIPRRLDAERWLRILLRVSAPILLLAWPTLFFPVELQADWHRRLGLGEFPASPLVDYLSRSIAVLYGTRGVVYLMLARDVRRFLPLIRCFGWMDVVAGLALLGIDLHAGMPALWTAVEGPSILAFGVVLLLLAARVEEPS